jgi:hypothetical protein
MFYQSSSKKDKLLWYKVLYNIALIQGISSIKWGKISDRQTRLKRFHRNLYKEVPLFASLSGLPNLTHMIGISCCSNFCFRDSFCSLFYCMLRYAIFVICFFVFYVYVTTNKPNVYFPLKYINWNVLSEFK